jgi:hypothetical protein
MKRLMIYPMLVAIFLATVQVVLWGPSRIWAAWRSAQGVHTLELKYKIVRQLLFED